MEMLGLSRDEYRLLTDRALTLAELDGALYFQNSVTSYSFNTAVGHHLVLSAQNTKRLVVFTVG